ncbi:hypothetical protein NMY22_g2050 [Coprinellus aureogranulatus]|nr:hypothetical protein NMY22_g2050 [Coprinellus aureogranulatus]
MATARPDFHRTLGRLARTNAPPSAQDAEFIRETVGDIKKKAAEIRSQIQDLEATLQDLEHEHQFFEPILSPMRRMPLEVLGEIFIRAVEAPFYMHQGTLSRISRVCKSWREAAHLVPRLWTTTFIDPCSPGLSHESVAMWISHSRGLPHRMIVRSLECGIAGVSGPRCEGEGSCVFSKSVLAKILKTAPYLDKVEICGPTSQCFVNLAKSIHSSPSSATWHSVRTLTVDGDHWISPWQSIPSSAFHHLFPTSITNFDLSLPWDAGIDLPMEELELNIPSIILKRLSSFTLALGWSSYHIFGILRHCTNLEALELRAGGSELPWGFHDAFIQEVKERGLVLPKLRKICVLYIDACSMKRLRFLNAPTLLDVHVQFGQQDWTPEETDGNMNEIDGHSGSAFSAFMKTFSDQPSTVRTLSITSGVFKDDSLRRLLQDLPNLKQLTLFNAVFNNDTFASMPSKDYLPNLQSLKLLCLHVNPKKLVGLQDFVKQRRTKLKITRCTAEDCEGAD